MDKRQKTIVIVTAGTGGHIFPGVALAEEVKERGRRVLLLGRKDGMEEKIVKDSGLPFFGYHFFKNIFSFALFCGIIQCLIFFQREKPEAVIACGSYASLPPILASLILGFPLYLLEQNVIPGKMIRFFAPFARYIFFGFPPQIKIRGRGSVTGNPIRRMIKVIKERKEESILILGGSQGARILAHFFKKIAEEFPTEKFLIQVREDDFGKIKSDAPRNCSFFVFTPDVREIFTRAKLVVSRAGGITISEILFLGLPAILIPYPYAASGHQEANARFCAARGGAVMIKESELVKEKERIKKLLSSLLADAQKRSEMGRRAKELGKDGTEMILDFLGVGR